MVGVRVKIQGVVRMARAQHDPTPTAAGRSRCS